MVARLREVAKERSRSKGRLCSYELKSHFLSARLHEVLSICTSCRKPLPIALPLHSETDTICHKFRHVRVKTRALVEPFRYRQARGRPQEAAREVHALLEVLRENEGAVQAMRKLCQELLRAAICRLNILDPELGEEELIKSVAAALANMASKDEVQEGPGGA